MCLGIPGKIIETDGKTATAEILGVERRISVELLTDVKVGNYVLIHAGCAIQLVDEEEAAITINLFNELRVIENG